MPKRKGVAMVFSEDSLPMQWLMKNTVSSNEVSVLKAKFSDTIHPLLTMLWFANRKALHVHWLLWIELLGRLRKNLFHSDVSVRKAARKE